MAYQHVGRSYTTICPCMMGLVVVRLLNRDKKNMAASFLNRRHLGRVWYCNLAMWLTCRSRSCVFVDSYSLSFILECVVRCISLIVRGSSPHLLS